jgi:hypothetical protein
MSLGEVSVQSESALEVRTRLVHSIGATVELKASFEVRLIRLDVRGLA